MAQPGTFDPALVGAGLFDPAAAGPGLFDPGFLGAAAAAVYPDAFRADGPALRPGRVLLLPADHAG